MLGASRRAGFGGGARAATPAGQRVFWFLPPKGAAVRPHAGAVSRGDGGGSGLPAPPGGAPSWPAASCRRTGGGAGGDRE